MVYNAGDLFSVAFKHSNDLFSILVEDDSILVVST